MLKSAPSTQCHPWPVRPPEDGLVSHDADTFPLPLDLDDDRLEALDDILVGLPRRVPGQGGRKGGGMSRERCGYITHGHTWHSAPTNRLSLDI